MDLNKVQLIGNITQDIELKQTPTGQHVSNFTVATNRSWVDAAGIKQEVAEFHNIVFWGKQAEVAAQYLGKGKKVYIEGRLQTRSWEGPDGTNRYKTEIVGEQLIMLNPKSQSQGDENIQKSNNTQQVSTPQANVVKKPTPKKEEEISIEDIPF